MSWHQTRKGVVPLKCHKRAKWQTNPNSGYLHKNQQLWFGQQFRLPLVGFEGFGDCNNQHNHWWREVRTNRHHLEERSSSLPKSSIWNVTFHNSCWTITTQKLLRKLFLKPGYFPQLPPTFIFAIKYWLDIFLSSFPFLLIFSGWKNIEILHNCFSQLKNIEILHNCFSQLDQVSPIRGPTALHTR